MTPLTGDMFFLFLTVGIVLAVRGIMFYGSADSQPPEKQRAQVLKGVALVAVGLSTVLSPALGFVHFLRSHM
ncbi:hypothetical protein POL68_07925 [Stigmatella sp. ncwal1]|uniref:Uncharacterized protein n=1 Tax=Stigmatella ashevillensis TaxID=2995309 RepID=A0ABT5D7Z1_9BACT|nr:hypothetical protein [Stigmatella ashevillena]MDC0708391.1 hypothetical protein [Stigmatella ashevillena]